MGCNIAAKVELSATAAPDALIRAIQSGDVRENIPAVAKPEPANVLSDLIEQFTVALDPRRVERQLNRVLDRLMPAPTDPSDNPATGTGRRPNER